MERIKKSVFEWVNKSDDLFPSFNTLIELKGTYNGEEIEIASAGDVKATLIQLFGERNFYPLFGDDETITEQLILTKISNMYSNWKTSKLTNMLRAFSALQAEYNPLDNYNGYEKTEIKYGKTTDTEYGKTDTTTHGKTNTLETDVYGYNSGENGADSDKVTSTDGGTTEIIYGGTDGIKEGGTETHELTKRGNLGVTTNFQMISGEWDLRARNYVIDVLRDFINLYTAY